MSHSHVDDLLRWVVGDGSWIAEADTEPVEYSDHNDDSDRKHGDDQRPPGKSDAPTRN